MEEGTTNGSLKRRRVTRACDECRRKKIKCDGRLPCTHCTVYSYNCTFDQPSNRRRNCPTGYVEKLEHKCARYEVLFRRLLPNLDLEREIDGYGSNESEKRDTEEEADEQALESPLKAEQRSQNSPISMHGQGLKLNRDEDGNVDFRGNSSGSVFLQTVYGQLGVDGKEHTSADLYAHKSLHDTKVHNQDRSRTASDETDKSRTTKTDASQDILDDIQLPEYEIAYQLTRLCFDKACCIIQFVHEPSFYTRLSNCYNSADDAPNDDNFLGVLYSVLAVGCLFLGSIQGGLGIEEPKIRAFQYFQASKSVIDPMDRANTEILQTIICQILFLQSTGNMSTCWTYVGTALRCAQRMGLHKKFEDGFDPVERQLRCKMFWSIRNIEIFLHSILGLPRGIADEDFDQSLPLEIDDEHITPTNITAQPAGQLSIVVSFNAYSRLITIMADIVRLCFPLNNTYERTQRIASQGTIDSLDRRLEQWNQSLHPMLSMQKQFKELDITVFRQSRLLRYAYFHAYLLLHRPYLHYIASEDERFADQRRYGQKAKAASIGVLQLTEEIFINEPTCFGHWFSIYGTFFAGMMVLYSLKTEHPEKEKSERSECLRYLEIAKQAMSLCSKCSYAAERCHDMLDELAKQVPVQESISTAASRTFTTVRQRGLSPTSNSTAHYRGSSSASNKIKHEGTGSSRTRSGPIKNESPSDNSAATQMDNLNLATNNNNLPGSSQVPAGLSRSEQIALQQGLFPMSPSMYGYQPYPMLPQTAILNLHTQDTYQPFLGQPNYQDYFSALNQGDLNAQPGTHPFPQDYSTIDAYKSDAAVNQWSDQYGSQSDDLGQFIATMDNNQGNFMFPAYPHEQYRQ